VLTIGLYCLSFSDKKLYWIWLTSGFYMTKTTISNYVFCILIFFRLDLQLLFLRRGYIFHGKTISKLTDTVKIIVHFFPQVNLFNPKKYWFSKTYGKDNFENCFKNCLTVRSGPKNVISVSDLCEPVSWGIY
jgi:hypothetical protein